MGQQKIARPRRKRPVAAPAPTTPDAIEIAMEAEARGRPATGAAADVLRRHAQLLGWQVASERATFGLKILTGIVGFAVAVVIVLLVWTSSRYQGLVVQAFAAPPDLVARGLTGEVLAGELMDRLVAMQEQTDSVRAPGSYAIDWSDGTEVEIPQTGVSIGELRRYLRSWLGKETRISGVVYRREDGQLAVTARTGGSASETFVGSETELESLMIKAAESVYARTQPYRYTVYLLDHDRAVEAEPVWRSAERFGEPESLWLIRGWGLELARNGDPRAALEKFRWVETRTPDMGPLYQAIGDAEFALGHEEAAYQARKRAARLIAHSRDVDPKRRAAYAASQAADVAMALYDVKAVEAAAAVGGDYAVSAKTLSFLRWDLAAVAAEIAGPLPEDASPDDRLARLMDNIELAWARQDYDQALPLLDQITAGAGQARFLMLGPTILGPARIELLLGLGRNEEARALAATLPDDCYACVIGKATVAEATGDRPTADRLFARAERMAPSLPDASHHWGRTLLKRGDTAGAVRRFEEARRRAPHWADNAKYWGDALMARGDAAGAVRKYREAERTVPRWSALHLAWGRALDRLGRREEALTHWRRVRPEDVPPADRTEVRRRLGSA